MQPSTEQRRGEERSPEVDRGRPMEHGVRKPLIRADSAGLWRFTGRGGGLTQSTYKSQFPDLELCCSRNISINSINNEMQALSTGSPGREADCIWPRCYGKRRRRISEGLQSARFTGQESKDGRQPSPVDRCGGGAPLKPLVSPIK